LTGTEPGFGGGAGALAFLPFIPWHLLYFFPLPQGHGAFLPTFIRGITFWRARYMYFPWGWLETRDLVQSNMGMLDRKAGEDQELVETPCCLLREQASIVKQIGYRRLTGNAVGT
jgi:hypothetical protein